MTSRFYRVYLLGKESDIVECIEGGAEEILCFVKEPRNRGHCNFLRKFFRQSAESRNSAKTETSE